MQIKAFFQLISKAAPVWPRADSIGRILPPSFLFQSVSRWSGCGVNFTSFQFQSIEICQDVWGLCGLIARLELINQEHCSTPPSLSLCTGSQTMLWQWSQNERLVTVIAVLLGTVVQWSPNDRRAVAGSTIRYFSDQSFGCWYNTIALAGDTIPSHWLVQYHHIHYSSVIPSSTFFN